MGTGIEDRFDSLVERVKSCVVCERMCSSRRVLNRGCGPLDADILVVGEAPGRLGADASELPFHGDKAGHNFEQLLEFAGLGRANVFITNAVLCNPKDERGNNSTPTTKEVTACASFLRDQIDLVNPKIVVTLGAIALRSAGHIEEHGFSLSNGVRTSINWYGRELIPLYHPGQRAMIHRSFANQAADYQYVAERLRRGSARKSNVAGSSNRESVALVNEIVRKFGEISYFALHKLSYLAEHFYFQRHGVRLTGAYYVRQKDGPYCVDAHPQRLARAGAQVAVSSRAGGIRVSPVTIDLFRENESAIEDELAELVDELHRKYAGISDEGLKTVVYMTAPMRRILRLERAGSNQFNAPIVFTALARGSNSPRRAEPV